LPRLRLIVTAGKKNASIDTIAAVKHGITVCGTDSPGFATAELTMGLMLALSRQLVRQTNDLHQDNWQGVLGRDLRGATLGIIGLGRLGKEVARMAKCFGMTVLAWSQNLTPETCTDAGVHLVTKTELFTQSDFISIHMRLSERTHGLVGERELAMMKPDAYLINTSRAPIIDTRALINALTHNRLAGAALDVFDEEPLPADDPLRSVPNLLLTPHIGYVTRETYKVFYGQMVEAITAYSNGNPVRVIATPSDNNTNQSEANT
jgi:phosphoglycerate dehydrogenase-like enzyme